MTYPVITTQNLGKSYLMGALKKDLTLREGLTEALHYPFNCARSIFSGKGTFKRHPEETIWALRDISFNVQCGEIVGVVGPNGSGKSTLLKVLSRITPPSSGYAQVVGRLGSLLEVGTGFHPELTGRENLYLSGAILGMRRKELDKKFDEIVAFAEVEKFLDTPIKRYSSGMSLRLAFSLAAHVEPDILLVDEVLAVGDLGFQSKCLKKIQDATQSARTVLFVSHNLAAIRRLCSRVLCLQNGRLSFDGDVDEGLSRYQHTILDSAGSVSGRYERNRSISSPATWISAVEMRDSKGLCTSRFNFGDSVEIRIQLSGAPVCHGYSIGWFISDLSGNRISWSNSVQTCGYYLNKGQHQVKCRIQHLSLAAGRYFLSLEGGIPGLYRQNDSWRESAIFEIADCDPYKTGHQHFGEFHGCTVLEHSWSD